MVVTPTAALSPSPRDAMSTPRIPSALLLVALVASVFLLPGCSETWLRVQNIPEDGFTRTLNYQFQARVHADSLGECQMMVVRVKPLNKMYSKDEPPPRLQLFDDDCMSPLRFERVHYVSKDNGAHIRLSGLEVNHFMSNNFRLEGELIGWLWRAGVI